MAMLSDLTGFAVDLGGTKMAAARIERGVLVAQERAATDGAASPEAHVAAMSEMLGRLGYGRGAPLGLAVTGRIDAAGLWHAVNSDTLSDVAGFDLGSAVARGIGPATCLNDAAAAALAEAQIGAGRGAQSFAYITVSTGVGGGLIHAGRLLTSANGLAGHVGFATSSGAEARCGSGRRGTVESVAGGRAMARAARAAGHDVDARAVSEAARDGAPWAEAIVARSADAIAALIADLAAILGLDAVAIGGSIGLSEGYIARVSTALATEPALFRVPLSPAALGTDAPLLGALAFRHEEPAP